MSIGYTPGRRVEILLVEDNPGDVRLTIEDLEQFITVVKSIEDFWLTIVTLQQHA